ncbi:MAG: HaeIII family restriction endonuclease [Puniceicoccales bacterium]|jgi:hypothetical protein|nr:HaeIII family restriction endonuclease [Puniceicoccales bacterium]
MPNKTTIRCTINGKAYEYACVLAIKELVEPYRPIEIVESTSVSIARERYVSAEISVTCRAEMLASAKAGIHEIIGMEPRILGDGGDTLTVSLQPDNVARSGDVRDVLIIRRNIKWEIGISVKHNHEALKHNRLSKKLDFGYKWYNIACSEEYFSFIRPIFDSLYNLKAKKTLWSDLPNKEETVYVPLLQAFQTELERARSIDESKLASGLVKYLLGSNGSDYYKLIHYNHHKTKIVPFNLCGTLNQPADSMKPKRIIPRIELPSSIGKVYFKQGVRNTIILEMNNFWALSFRIHNATSRVEPSLKFDIQLAGQPSNLWFLDVAW